MALAVRVLLMLAESALVTTTDPDETMTEGELLIKVRSSLAAVTDTESVKSVIRIGHAAAGHAAVLWIALAVVTDTTSGEPVTPNCNPLASLRLMCKAR